MPELTIYQGDNLETLRRLIAAGERFDLVECDGPYGAGLEAWDDLDADAYLAHYADRLPLVRDVMQPWGVMFLFGYPEGCAEIKAWARGTKTLQLLRWLTWYKNSSVHAGRKVETITVFGTYRQLLGELGKQFRVFLRAARLAKGWRIVDAMRQTGINEKYAHKAGFFWFESDSAPAPRPDQYRILKHVFGLPDQFDALCTIDSYDGITNIDFLTVPPESAISLNDSGLRSKSRALYNRIFGAVTFPHAQEKLRRALILYGGSGNAAIAAGKLGYDVTVCETDPARCALTQRRWDMLVNHTYQPDDYGPLFAGVSERAS